MWAKTAIWSRKSALSYTKRSHGARRPDTEYTALGRSCPAKQMRNRTCSGFLQWQAGGIYAYKNSCRKTGKTDFPKATFRFSKNKTNGRTSLKDSFYPVKGHQTHHKKPPNKDSDTTFRTSKGHLSAVFQPTERHQILLNN